VAGDIRNKFKLSSKVIGTQGLKARNTTEASCSQQTTAGVQRRLSPADGNPNVNSEAPTGAMPKELAMPVYWAPESVELSSPL
jgi:hypothetical protein